MPIHIHQQAKTFGLIGATTLALAIAFSGCVPTEPPPPPENTLHFVPASGTDAGNILQRWNPDTGELTTVARSSAGIWLQSGQPHGSTLLYETGVAIGYGGVAAFVTTNPDDKTQGVHRISSINTLTGSSGSSTPVWSPDGSHLTFTDGDTLYISTPIGSKIAVGPADSAEYLRQWSPDSKKLLYVSGAWPNKTLRVYDVTTGQDHLLFTNSWQISTGSWRVWHADSRHLTVDITTEDDVVLAQFDTAAADPSAYTEVLRRDGDSATLETHVVPSPRGDRALYETRDKTSNATTRSMVFFDGRADVDLGAYRAGQSLRGWSYDGAYLAYARLNENGSNEAVVVNSDAVVVSTYPMPAEFSLPGLSWATQSNSLAIGWSSAGESVDVIALNPASSQWASVYSGGGSYISKFTWSPNGQYLAFKPAYAATAYFYDRREANNPAQPLDTDYTAFNWAANSKQLTLCAAGTNSCQPSVLSITPTGYSITQVPVIANAQFVWSTPNF